MPRCNSCTPSDYVFKDNSDAEHIANQLKEFNYTIGLNKDWYIKDNRIHILTKEVHKDIKYLFSLL